MLLLTPGGTALSLPVTSYIIHRVRGIWEQFWGRLHPFEVIFNKNNLISSVFYCLPVILLQMRGVRGALLSVRACALALWGHVSQWMQGTWGAVWVFAHAPRNPFKWLRRTWEQFGGLCMRSRSMGHVTKWRQNMQIRSGGQLKQ